MIDKRLWIVFGGIVLVSAAFLLLDFRVTVNVSYLLSPPPHLLYAHQHQLLHEISLRSSS